MGQSGGRDWVEGEGEQWRRKSRRQLMLRWVAENGERKSGEE